MKTIRIIPRLDIKGPNLVKGIHLEGLRVLGRPSDFAKYYYEQGADELIFMDVVASLYGRNSLQDIISETAKSIFIPITVGGGLRSIEDIKSVLRAGADKVSLNTAAINNPKLIEDAAKKFGSSTIVVSIEAIKESDGRYLAYTDNGREYTGMDAIEWAKQVCDAGAGEIVVTSVDREGTGEGFDIDLVKRINEVVSIPVVAHGGPAHSEHVAEVIQKAKADAVSVASILHYEAIQNFEHNASETEGNTQFLKEKRGFHKFVPTNLGDLKKHLVESNIPVRL